MCAKICSLFTFSLHQLLTHPAAASHSGWAIKQYRLPPLPSVINIDTCFYGFLLQWSTFYLVMVAMVMNQIVLYLTSAVVHLWCYLKQVCSLQERPEYTFYLNYFYTFISKNRSTSGELAYGAPAVWSSNMIIMCSMPIKACTGFPENKLHWLALLTANNKKNPQTWIIR